MKKIVLLLTFITGSFLMHAAAPARSPEQELREAARDGDIEAVERLLQVPGIDVNKGNRFGETALMFAATFDHADIVALLLSADGINIDATEDDVGWTALMYAAASDNQSIAAMLLQAGADKTIQNKKRKTAEEVAREAGGSELADYIRDYEQTPIKSARKR